MSAAEVLSIHCENRLILPKEQPRLDAAVLWYPPSPPVAELQFIANCPLISFWQAFFVACLIEMTPYCPKALGGQQEINTRYTPSKHLTKAHGEQSKK